MAALCRGTSNLWPISAPSSRPAPPRTVLRRQRRVRQENDFGGNVTVRTGWQWRGQSGHLFRFGLQYFNGMSDQTQFFNRFEQQIGGGLWYDF